MPIRIALVALLSFAAQLPAADGFALVSPDGAVQFHLSLDGNARLQYSVTFKEKPVIAASAIGITVDGVNLADGVDLGRVDPYKVDETYPWNGVHSLAVDKCNGARIMAAISSSIGSSSTTNIVTGGWLDWLPFVPAILRIKNTPTRLLASALIKVIHNPP